MLKQPEHSGTLPMTHEFIRTEDGSTTLYVPELNEHYHSVHGAVQESMHIFVRAGIEYYRENIQNSPDPLRILEAGFGTGLNAYLTLAYTATQELPVVYHSLEKYPLTPEEAARLNYTEQIPYPRPEHFARLHEVPGKRLRQLRRIFPFANIGRICGTPPSRQNTTSYFSMPSTPMCSPTSGRKKCSGGSSMP